MTTEMPRASHAGSSSVSADWSSRVYRPAHRKTSMSASRANRPSISAWFMPAPMAPMTPWSRRSWSAGYALVDGRPPVVVGVVEVHDVDTFDAQPLQALVERPPDAVAAEVPHRPVVRHAMEDGRAGELLGRGRAQEPTDLGRQHVAVARVLSEDGPQSPLRLAVAVLRGRVEVADASLPGVLDHRDCVGFGDGGVQAGDGRAAETPVG